MQEGLETHGLLGLAGQPGPPWGADPELVVSYSAPSSEIPSEGLACC